MGIAAVATRSFSTLSGGEKQRALIARAPVQEGRVLILDKPTNHLDIRYQLEVLELVRDVGVTTLMSIRRRESGIGVIAITLLFCRVVTSKRPGRWRRS